MTETTRNLWVGLFVIVALGVLAVLMVWFGEAPSWLGGNEWTLQIRGVRELRGISDGSPVTLNGVEIGRVKGVDFKDRNRPDRGVVIVARIKNEYDVPRSAVAYVYGATLGVGTGHVDIVVEPGTRADLLPRQDASIPGEMKSAFGEIITKDMLSSLEHTVTHVGELTREWTPVGTNLAKLLEQRPVETVEQPGAAEKGMIPNLTTVMQRLDRLIANLNVVLGDEDIQADVKAAAADLRDASSELKQTMILWKSESQKVADNINQGVDRTEEQLDSSFRKLHEVLEHVDDSARSMARTTQAIAEGKGTAGLLVRDERLYESAVLAVQRFGEAMATLERILAKFEADGYITVGQAPTGLLKKRFDIPDPPPESR